MQQIEPRLTNARKLAELLEEKTREERKAQLEARAKEAEQEARPRRTRPARRSRRPPRRRRRPKQSGNDADKVRQQRRRPGSSVKRPRNCARRPANCASRPSATVGTPTKTPDPDPAAQGAGRRSQGPGGSRKDAQRSAHAHVWSRGPVRTKSRARPIGCWRSKNACKPRSRSSRSRTRDDSARRSAKWTKEQQAESGESQGSSAEGGGTHPTIAGKDGSRRHGARAEGSRDGPGIARCAGTSSARQHQREDERGPRADRTKQIERGPGQSSGHSVRESEKARQEPGGQPRGRAGIDWPRNCARRRRSWPN